MAGVSIRQVQKTFGAAKILHGVSIEVPDRSFTVLVGPSGCGKSTLLRMIAGLEEISGGEILIGGVVVNRMPPKERDIAMVFQNYALYPHMKVFDNMAFSLRLAKIDEATIRAKVEEAARILNLTAYLNRYPRQLSGGQRQRVAMGRAIVRNPQVFLFDEPLSNLDAALRVAMRTEIRELHQRLSSTSIYVTHDQIEAMTMADQIVVMRDGRVEQAGAPLELYDRPANVFVAGFIGSPAMNFLKGRVARGEGAPMLLLGDEARLSLPPEAPVREGETVTLGSRPEDIVLSANGAGLRATVAVVEPTGAETLIFARAAGQEVLASLRERREIRPGQPVRLAPRPDRMHLFDTESGRRLSG